MSALSIRVDENVRRGAEMAFKSMGLSMADGVRAYLNYVNVTKKLPFLPVADQWYAHDNSSHIPNDETVAAMNEKGTKTSLKELREIMGL